MRSALLCVLCTLLQCNRLVADEGTIAQQHMAAIQRYMQTREAGALTSIRSGLRAAAPYPTLRHRIASDLGVVLLQTGQAEEAVRQLRDAVDGNPSLFMAQNALGIALEHTNQPREAADAFKAAIQAQPSFGEAYSNLATWVLNTGDASRAVALCQIAVGLNPKLPQAYVNLGNALAAQGEYEAAIAPLGMAAKLRASTLALDANLLHAKQAICQWRGYRNDHRRLTRKLQAATGTDRPSQGLLNTMAFPYTMVMLGVRESVAFAAVQAYAARVEASASALPGPFRDHSMDKAGLTIGYLSADFREHPLAHLMLGVFVSRGPRYRLQGFSLASDRSKVRREITAAAHAFTDVASHSDIKAAEAVSEARIDILVDLNGYTRGHRPRILSARPAAIQILLGVGYPGSSGLRRSIDYFVGDRGAASPMVRGFYTERLVLLPFCYQPNSYGAIKPIKKFPIHGAVVFGMYNRNFKVDPAIFKAWTNAMRRVDTAVLEMLSPPAAAANLYMEAAAEAVHPQRLKPVRRAPRIAHLHRTAAADLFLDSHFYNAHTTGSDALWAGLPLVTLQGGSGFASRVSSSLLRANGVSEAVVASHKEYEDLVAVLAVGARG